MTAKLLVVDDAPGMLLAYRNFLQPVVGEIDAARSLEEAKALLPAHAYDVVITDLCLTKPAGREGLEIIQVAKQQASPPKVILVTGQANPNVITAARELGADLCFEKPLEPRVLVSAVTGFLSDGHSYDTSAGADHPRALRGSA